MNVIHKQTGLIIQAFGGRHCEELKSVNLLCTMSG